jgi:hypothetical protein
MNEAEEIRAALGPTLHQFAAAMGVKDLRTAKSWALKMGMTLVKTGGATFCQCPRGREFFRQVGLLEPANERRTRNVDGSA